MNSISQESINAAFSQIAREIRSSPPEVVDIAELAAEVDALPPVQYLIRPLWPADAYGVLGAQDKAGKTWMVVDLAISVASGTPFLGRFPTDAPGPVVLYCGEGGARNIVRRVRAVAASKGIELEALRGLLRVSERAPQIAQEDALERVLTDLLGHDDTRLVVIDPLYLAAAGADGSNLYKMGEALTGIQSVCQVVGAALILTTHWNKTGVGKGAQRFTGVGPGAWGRVLGSGEVTGSRTLGDGASEVNISWEFTGSEIAETVFDVTRRVRAEDPEDLSSPLHYAVEVVEGFARIARRPPSEQKVLDALGQRPGEWFTRQQIADAAGLHPQTVKEPLRSLAANDTIEANTPRGKTGVYRLLPPTTTPPEDPA